MARQAFLPIKTKSYLPTPPPSTRTTRYRSLNDKYDRTVGRFGGKTYSSLWQQKKDQDEKHLQGAYDDHDEVWLGEMLGEESVVDEGWKSVARDRRLSAVMGKKKVMPEYEFEDRLVDEIIFKEPRSSNKASNAAAFQVRSNGSAHAGLIEHMEGQQPGMPSMPYPTSQQRQQDSSYVAVRHFQNDENHEWNRKLAIPYLAQEHGPVSRSTIKGDIGPYMVQQHEAYAPPRRPEAVNHFIQRQRDEPADNGKPELYPPDREALGFSPEPPYLPANTLPVFPPLPPMPGYPYPYSYPCPYPYSPWLFPYPYDFPAAQPPPIPPPTGAFPTLDAPGYSTYPLPMRQDFVQPPIAMDPRLSDGDINRDPRSVHQSEIREQNRPNERIPTPLLEAHDAILPPQAKMLQQRLIKRSSLGKRKGRAFVKALEECVEDHEESGTDDSDELRLKTPMKLANGKYAPAEWDIIPPEDSGLSRPSCLRKRAFPVPDKSTIKEDLSNTSLDTVPAEEARRRTGLPSPSERRRSLMVNSIKRAGLDDDSDANGHTMSYKAMEDEDESITTNVSPCNRQPNGYQHLDSTGRLDEQMIEQEHDECSENELNPLQVLDDVLGKVEPDLSPSPAPRTKKVTDYAFGFDLPIAVARPHQAIKQKKKAKTREVQAGQAARITEVNGRPIQIKLVSSLKKPDTILKNGQRQDGTIPRRVTWQATQESIAEFSESSTLDDEVGSYALQEGDDEGCLSAVQEMMWSSSEDVMRGQPEQRWVDGGFFGEDAGDIGFTVRRDGY